jgi:hypothetical protein
MCNPNRLWPYTHTYDEKSVRHSTLLASNRVVLINTVLLFPLGLVHYSKMIESPSCAVSLPPHTHRPQESSVQLRLGVPKAFHSLLVAHISLVIS